MTINSMVEKFGSHNMTVIFSNLCYSQVCYKGAALYLSGLEE